MANQIVDFFGGTGDYTSRMSALERQRKMAEMLQQQAASPIETPTAGGVAGPIHWTSVLAKALQGYGANVKEARANEEESKLRTDRASKLASMLAPEDYSQSDALGSGASVGGMDFAVNAPRVDQNADKRQKFAELLKMGIGNEAAEAQAMQSLGLGGTSEFDTTPRVGVNPQTGKREQYIMDKGGNLKWLGVAPETKMELNNNQAYDPYSIQAGAKLDDTMSAEAEAQKKRIANAGAARSTVNVGQSEYGAIPAGFALTKKPDGSLAMYPIDGGPEAAKAKKEQNAASGKAAQADIVVGTIDELANKVKENNVTGLGSLMSGIPGTAAKDVSAMIDTVKANVGFDKLQQMRDNSPTGGALGQVSEFENRLLQSTIASLDQAQSQEQFLSNLAKVRKVYNEVVNYGLNEDGTTKIKPQFPSQSPASGALSPAEQQELEELRRKFGK